MSKVVLLTGPSGAGKTTTAETFLQTAAGTWAYVNQDEIRQMIVAGYASAGDYNYNWSDETKQQWEVSIPICADIVRRYSEHGISCVVDFFAPPEEFEEWKQYLAGVDYRLFVLLPDVETAVLRNAGRSERSRLKENIIRQNHARFQSWLETTKDATIIDTTKNTATDTVAQIREAIELTKSRYLLMLA